MLRITEESLPSLKVVLRIEGWVSEADVGLLEQTCRFRQDQDGYLILDLNGVQDIDEGGIDVLRRCAAYPLELRGGSAFIRELLKTYGLDAGMWRE